MADGFTRVVEYIFSNLRTEFARNSAFPLPLLKWWFSLWVNMFMWSYTPRCGFSDCSILTMKYLGNDLFRECESCGEGFIPPPHHAGTYFTLPVNSHKCNPAPLHIVHQLSTTFIRCPCEHLFGCYSTDAKPHLTLIESDHRHSRQNPMWSRCAICNPAELMVCELTVKLN